MKHSLFGIALAGLLGVAFSVGACSSSSSSGSFSCPAVGSKPCPMDPAVTQQQNQICQACQSQDYPWIGVGAAEHEAHDRARKQEIQARYGKARSQRCRKRQNQERMRLKTAALEAAANGVAITDLNGTIQWINPAFTQLTGYSSEEVIGRNTSLLKSGRNPESLYKEMWQTISTRSSGAFEWSTSTTQKSRDGRRHALFWATCSPTKPTASPLPRL